MAELPIETLTTAEKTGIRGGIAAIGSDPDLITEFTGSAITNEIACTMAQYAMIADPGASYPTTKFTFTDAAMSDYGAPVIGQWTADTGSTAATPDAGQLRWNNATQTSATALYLDGVTAGGIDMAALLKLVADGDTLLIQSGAANYQIWTLSAAPSVSSGNWTLAATLDSSAGTGTTGFADGDALIVAVRPASVAGGGTTSIARTAWVETTGDDGTGSVGDITKPFQTIDAALAALGTSSSTCKIVRIGVGRFGPVSGAVVGTSGGPNYAATSIIYDNTKFIGSGKPRIASDSSTLVDGSGTIIVGPLGADNNGITYQDLGVDSGTTEVTARYAGAAQDALVLFNQGQVASPGTKAPRTGCVVSNVVGLCKAANSAVHGALFENLDGADISNVETRFGAFGTIIKTINSTVRGIRTDSHDTSSLIIKANAYAPCYNVTVSDVIMGSVADAGGNGLRFDCADGSAPDLFDCVVTGVVAKNVVTAVSWVGGASATLKRCRVDGLITNGVTNRFDTSGTLERYTLLINGVSLRTTPTLLNSWANYGSGNADAEWWLEDGAIMVDGVIVSGSIPAYVFNLPAAVLPSTTKRAPIVCNNSGTWNLGDLVIDGTGVYFESGVATSFASISSRYPTP